jgi:hypothetical protein
MLEDIELELARIVREAEARAIIAISSQQFGEAFLTDDELVGIRERRSVSRMKEAA